MYFFECLPDTLLFVRMCNPQTPECQSLIKNRRLKYCRRFSGKHWWSMDWAPRL